MLTDHVLHEGFGNDLGGFKWNGDHVAQEVVDEDEQGFLVLGSSGQRAEDVD